MANIYTDIAMFNAELYLAKNPDVADAIKGKEITAQDHYFLHGAAESLTNNDRAPNAWFNAAEYKAQNVDLADVDANLLLAHFALHGVNEGRAPNAATAGEDGKIKPELLNDYVNAEGNADVKAAIAEMTGKEVGAELTAEQAIIAMQHFFNYGINEPRKGGIADVISAAGEDEETNSLTEALEALAAAQDAEASFLNAQIDNELLTGLTSTSTLADIRAAINTAASTAANTLKDARDPAKAGKSDNILNAELLDAQEALAAEEAKVAKVDGLKAKIEARDATAAAKTAADDAATDATAAVTGAEATFNALAANTAITAAYTAPSVFPVPAGNLVVDSKDSNAPMISIDAQGNITVAAAYKNAAGIDTLLAAVQADVAALIAKDAATKAAAAALADTVATDEGTLDAAAKALATGVEGLTTASNTGALDTLLTTAVTAEVITAAESAQIKAAFLAELSDDTDWTNASDPGAAAEVTAAIAAAKAIYDPIVDAAADALAAAAAEAALITGYDLAATGVTTAQTAVDIRAELIKAANDTAALKAEAEALKGDVDTAKGIITNPEDHATLPGMDIELVEAAAGNIGFKVANDDLYLFNSADNNATVAEFSGKDAIYFGKGFNGGLVVVEDVKKDVGELTKLEVFAVQNGTNVDLYVEERSFAGNGSSDSADLVKITLTGVNAEDLSFADGFLTIA